jgi:DNA polymerase-3 subunit delta
MSKAARYQKGEDPGAMLRALGRDPLLPVYLLFGEEGYLVDRALGTVLGRLQGTEGGLRVRAGEDQLAARVEEALRTPPLFGGAPYAVVSEVESLREAEQGRLLELAQGACGGHLVLVGTTPDLRRRLYATCVREGWAFAFRRLPMARVPAWLRDEAQRLGHAIARDAVEMLVELVGADLRAGAGELDKLSLYVGVGEPITVEAVTAVVGATRARSVFELANLIQNRQLGPAFPLVRRLLSQGESPIAMVAFLGGQLRRMLVAKSLLASRRRPAEIASRLGVSPWVAERIAGGARRYDARTLQRAFARVAAADVAFKSSRASAPILLETCLLELLG